MKTWIYYYNGYWPIGAYMYVRAKDQNRADELFYENLPVGLEYKNPPKRLIRKRVKGGERAYVISDGNY